MKKRKAIPKKISLWFCIISIILISTSCKENTKIVSDTGIYFDTAITIILYGQENKKYLKECMKMCEYYENLFSTTITTSDISMINSNSHKNKSTIVSDETINIINESILFSTLSSGKFDITVGGLYNIWDFSGETTDIPNETLIKENLSSVNYKNILINHNSIMLTNPDSSITLGGIAKGYIADKIKDYLISKKIKSGIINLGGNVLLIGKKPDNTLYNIGIQKPFGGQGDNIAVISATDKSIVTSGIYERYFKLDDKVYHHILDTSTGYPVENDLLGVTIISDKSVDGDGYSTTALSLGLNEGMKLIENAPNTEGIFIDNNYKIHVTSGLLIENNSIIIK